MKNIYPLVIIILLVLSGCKSTPTEIIKTNINNELSCNINYIVWNGGQNNILLKSVVVLDNLKNISSAKSGIIEELNCNVWEIVNSNTIIATIKSDWSDPNIQSLNSQKNSLETQITNTYNIISQTKQNFNTQINSLDIQKSSLNKQIISTKENLISLKNQKQYWIQDLEVQISSLEEQLKNLEDSKNLLIDNKEGDLDKLSENITNLKKQIKVLISDTLLKIDEIYWVSDENKNLNDKYEIYLSAKDTWLKQDIKNKWIELNNKYLSIWDKNNEDISIYINEVSNLLNSIQKSVKLSVDSTVFSQAQIDSLYKIFLWYNNNIITLKTNFDTLTKTLTTTASNYDNQILSIKTQIDTVESNIDNLKSNKINSYINSLDVQINTLESQLNSLESSYINIINQIESLNSQEKIQISGFENQIQQLKSNISSININLQTLNIKAWINWTIKSKLSSVWNKINPNGALCTIVPNDINYKLQIFSPMKIELWTEFNFEKDNIIYTWNIVNQLTYKDKTTQNYIYESNYIENINLKEQDIINIILNFNTENINNFAKKDKKILIPIHFVITTIDGEYIKKHIDWKIYKNHIEIWNINGNMIEILNWIQIGDKICR